MAPTTVVDHAALRSNQAVIIAALLAAFVGDAAWPALLYFSTANCAPCQTALKPALRRLETELGERFQVLEVDAEAQTDAVRHWKVLSAPTIFVLGPQGKPRHVHYGMVRPEVLRAELGQFI